MPGSTHRSRSRAVADEEATLAEVVGLIRAGLGLDEWPDRPRRALLLALLDAPLPRAEAWKQVALARHLFGRPPDRLGDHLAMPDSPSWQERRRAERVRADLPAHVRLRGGVAWLEPRPHG